MLAHLELLRVLSVFLVSGYLVFRWQRKNLYQFASQISGIPDSLPVVGILYKCIGKSKAQVADMALDMARKMGPLVKFWLGPKLVVIVNDPRDIEITMNSQHCIQKSGLYKFFQFYKGLLVLSGDEWKKHRKYLNPSFNTKILKSFAPIFNEKSQILTEQLQSHVGKGEFDFFHFSMRCTLDMITSTSFGENLDFQRDSSRSQEYLYIIRTYMKMVSLRLFNIFHHIDWIYKFSNNSKTLHKCLDFLREYQKIIFKQRIKGLQSEDANLALDENGEYRKPQIFMDQLYRLSKTHSHIFDELAIEEETGMFLVAGFDTSSITVANIILLLAAHPDVQDKVYAEINEVFLSPDELPDFDIVTKLEYMERVILESMRLFPVGAVIARETTGEQRLVSDNLTIPAGVMLIYSVFTLHRDPKHWGTNADLFNPDHFLPENVRKRHPYSYLPFSAGPRNCIAGRYAMLSMKIMLVHMLRNYKFNTTYTIDKIKPRFDITLKLAHPHSVSIESRVQ